MSINNRETIAGFVIVVNWEVQQRYRLTLPLYLKEV